MKFKRKLTHTLLEVVKDGRQVCERDFTLFSTRKMQVTTVGCDYITVGKNWYIQYIKKKKKQLSSKIHCVGKPHPLLVTVQKEEPLWKMLGGCL